jgi:ABC-type multidrug transport system ATPase subunit
MPEEECVQYPIVIKNLHKRYDDKVAVEDLCLQLSYGECFGLLGPNGAGKTTTISMVRSHLYSITVRDINHSIEGK